jgi:hypothetical protein
LHAKYFRQTAVLDIILDDIIHLVLLKNGSAALSLRVCYTNKKENQIFLIYKEIKSGPVAKSYMRKGFLIYVIYEEMRKYFPIYEEAVSHI